MEGSCLKTSVSDLLKSTLSNNLPSTGERKSLLADRSRPLPCGSRCDPWYGAITTLKNEGSHARDYCAAERTFLSHIRLGLVLFSLTTALLCQSRFPSPDDPAEPDEIDLDGSVAVPLGTAFAAATFMTLIAGWTWYESMYCSMRIGKAFIEGDSKFHEATMSGVCVLILVTSLLFFSQSLAG